MFVARSVPPASGPVFERLGAQQAVVEGTTVARLLPRRARRTIGAWCFVDHFGPATTRMDVAPHPHIGLQTVTWLLQGEALHRDSLGTVQSIRPGQLNWMTAGRGISHSEQSPDEQPTLLHGVQLWVALPEATRDRSPAFEHHAELPVHEESGLRVIVLAGSAFDRVSPAKTDTPLSGLDLELSTPTPRRIELDPRFEYGLFVTEGGLRVEGEELPPSDLAYLGRGRDAIEVAGSPRARALLLGGEPLAEPLLMWWNFVARTEDEIRAAHHDWATAAERFGRVDGYLGPRIEAPALLGRA